MDQQKLRNLVFEKTGVRIDVDDPVFALVALNEAVLAEAVERHIALLHEASAQITGLPSRPVPAAAAAAAAAVPVAKPQNPAMLAGGAAVFGAVLVLIGQALFFRPAPAPKPVIVPAALSAEQTNQLRDAEKLTKVVEKLDKKTRTAIAAEMAKP
jgi:hypothetical protein